MSLADSLPRVPPGCGPVGLLSSDEFLPAAEAFDGAMLSGSRGRRVALLLAAAGDDAPNAARHGIAHYERLGADPFPVDVLRRDQARAGALGEFDVLFLCGGSPRLLLDCLRDTPLWDEALARWRDGATLAGSSAGAMALCEHSLAPRPGDRVPTTWERGLGPVAGAGLAVHASERPREWLERIARDAPCPVVALDNATGILLAEGAEPVVAGPGAARVLE